MTFAHLRLSTDDIDALAAGRLSTSLLSGLAAGQRTKRRLLLVAVQRALKGRQPSGLDTAVATLRRAAGLDPVAVEAVVARPLMNAAAIRCLSVIANKPPEVGDTAAVGFLSGLAATAAIRAGLRFELTLPVADRRLVLPGIGTFEDVAGDWVSARSDGSAFHIGGSKVTTESADRWRPARTIGPALDGRRSLELEDQDPARACFGYEPAPALGATEADRLSRHLDAAWRIITADHPQIAAAMRSNLRSVVPLASPAQPSDRALSASSRLAHGCVAVSEPTDAATLALMLVHEVRHMTLGAALDLADLYDGGGLPRHHAPWRLDPRPVGALLQGTYAHIGVTEFWAARRTRAAAAQRPVADQQFAYWREVTTRAARTLAESGELTPLGARFVDGLITVTRAWWEEPVGAGLATEARDRADSEAILWRVMNQHPQPGSIARLHGALRARRVAGHVGPPDIRTRPATPAHQRAGMAADVGLGEAATAAQAYRDRISRNPDDHEAWAGLSVALRRCGTEPAATVLSVRPDLVRELYKRSRAVDPSAWRPDDLAAWLASGLGKATER